MVCRSAMASVEGRIETGHLRQLRKALHQTANGRKVVRLMQRRERNEPREVCDHFGVDLSWAIVVRTAVNNPMTDSDRLEVLRVLQPPSRGSHRGRDVWHLFQRIGLVDQERVVRPVRTQTRPRSNSVKLTFHQTFEAGPSLDLKHLKFDARRAGVDDEDRVHGRSRCW